MTRSLFIVLAAVACGGQASEPQPAAPLPTATATATPTAAATASTTPVANEITPEPQQQGAVVVDRDTWVAAFETALPVALCKNGSYFRACFNNMTQVDCEQVTASATRVCVGKVRKQLPSKLHQPEEGTAWGSKIGSCVGTSLDAVLASKKIHDPKCDDPNAWTTPP